MDSPALSSMDNTLNPFIDTAFAHGVEHIVFLSVAGAAHNPLLTIPFKVLFLGARMVRRGFSYPTVWWSEKAIA